jgi:hypothetical protein
MLPPSVVGGPGPGPWWDQAPASSRGDSMYTTSPGTQDGVQSGTAVRGPAKGRRATASNLDTLLDRGFGRRVRMLLSFQRPSHLFGKGVPSYRARPRQPNRLLRSEPVSIAPDRGGVEALRTERSRRRQSASDQAIPVPSRWYRREPYASTWTVTVRVRGRSSKSISTTCCQVPSANSPPMIGTATDGPMIAARMWAWALSSWLSRLCS